MLWNWLSSCELEVEAEGVRELLESHDQPLSDEDLLAMEEQRRLLNEQETMPEDTAEPKEMTTKELEVGIAKIEDAIAYWERVILLNRLASNFPVLRGMIKRPVH
jgi:hypothetical protein